MSEFINETQVNENENITTDKEVFHPPIYPNSDNPKEVEKIVGEFNKYYTRLKRFFMVSKSDSEKIINDLKIEEITRLKLLLKYFLHKDKINMDDLRYVTQMIQEIHNKDYENRKKSEVKKPNKPKSRKPNYQSNQGFRRNNSKQNNNSYSRKTYSPNISSTSSYIRTFHDSHPYPTVETNKSQQKPDESVPIKPIDNSEKKEITQTSQQQTVISKPPKKEKSNSKYMRRMNFKHNNKNKK